MSAPISFVPPDPADLSKLLKGYEVTSLIATGGMGAVYKATQLSLERTVAIKLLPAEFGDDSSFRDRFHAEARAMARLNHANLIGIYDFGEADGMPYIVMEFVGGKSLHSSSHGKAVEQSAAIKLVIGICEGLAHAHRAGIIHRDIKPANILLDLKAKPKIGDFGLAAAADNEDDDGPLYGTPGYAAPEVYGDPKGIGNSFDIYAVGIMLYELLTGKKPEEPLSPPSTISTCDPRLDPIVKKATRRNPALRYQDAREMAEDLAKILPNLRQSGPRKMQTGTLSESPKGVPLQKKKAETQKDDGKPKLVPLPAKKSAASGATLKPLAEKPASPSPTPTASPPASSSPAPAPVKMGSNWPIIRNLLIIAALIPIIMFTWGIYQEKQEAQRIEEDERKAKRQREQKEREARIEKERQQEEERALERAREAAAKAAAEKRRQELLAIENAKTPMERLAEYRTALVNGSRDRFPDNTIDRSTHFLFFVETPMTWGAAADFAEDHGGHLATPATRAELDVLTKRMGDELDRIWLGGGARGKAGWAWVNGEDWTFKDPGTTLGPCASLSSTGVIRARPYGEKNPFVIQWSRDGENPGSLAAQLERLVPTLDTPTPAWPPTTVSHDSRHFLLVQESLPWSEADLIAASAEGHLAVVSNRAEAIFLRDFLADALLPGQSAWLGAKKKDELWTWTTGEPWERASWAEGAPDGDPSRTALRYLRNSSGPGWDDASPEAEDTVAFLIEWSSDGNRPEAETRTTKSNPIASFYRAREIARRLTRQELQGYRKFLVANRDSFTRDARVWFRVLSKSNKEEIGASYQAVLDGIPTNGDLSGQVNLEGAPAELQQFHQKALARQQRRKKKLDEKMESLRLSYLRKLGDLRDRFEENGLKSQSKTIEGEIEDVGQTAESFRAAMGE